MLGIYNFFASPLWQSIGVFVGTAGVFFGAKYGSKLGYDATLKSQREDLIESKKAYLLLVEDELRFNLNCLESIERYIIESPPTESIFDAAVAGSNSIRLNAWEAIVSAKVFPLLTTDEQTSLNTANQTIRNTIRIIQLENADWRRVREFNKYYDENPDPNMQRMHLKTLSSIRIRNLKNDLNEAIKIVKLSLSKFDPE